MSKRRQGLGALALAAGMAMTAPTAHAAHRVGPSPAVTTIHYGSQSPLQAADVYASSATAPQPVVIVLHVGGWETGGKGAAAPVAVDLSDHGFVVVNANYRLDSPTTAAFPMEVDDVRAVIQWTWAHIGAYGGDRRRITLVGGSAGGHLAMMAGLLEAKATPGEINGVVSLSGVSDLTNLRAQITVPPPRPNLVAALDRALGGCSTSPCPLAKPYSPALNVDPANCPPMLLFNENNELMPAAQAQEMAKRLRSAGCRVQIQVLTGRQHAFNYWSSASATVVAWIKGIDGVPAPP